MISRPNQQEMIRRTEEIDARLAATTDPATRDALRVAKRTVLELRQAVAIMDAACSAVVRNDHEHARGIAVLWRNAQPEEITR